MAKKKLRFSMGKTRPSIQLPAGGSGKGAATVPSLPPQGRPARRLPTGLLVLLGGVVVVIGILFFLYLRLIPGSVPELTAIYLRRANHAEVSSYLRLRNYLGEAEYNRSNRSQLESGAELLDDFARRFPRSLFCLAHGEIDYGEMFGLPDALVGRHQELGPHVAGTVTSSLAAYDEYLVRLRRKERREEELKEIAEYHREQEALRRAAELEAQRQARERRIETAKQARLAELLAVKAGVLRDQFKYTKEFKYGQVIAMLRPLATQRDPVYDEVAEWARRKIASLELAAKAYSLVPDSGLLLHGERVVVLLDGKPKRVEIRTIKNNKITVKYRELRRKDVEGKTEWVNDVVTRELPLSVVAPDEFETIARIAIERAKAREDYYSLMGTFFYYSGDRQRAATLLSKGTDERADFLRLEMRGG
jgi:hypothetical protein